MNRALDEARLALAEGEVPVGAVIVLDGRVIAAAHNQSVRAHDPTAHAEVVVMRMAGQSLGNYRLSGCELYVTLEPCAMCVGACAQARICRLIFGAPDPRWGALGSHLDLGTPGLFNHPFTAQGGILEDDCRALLQRFFEARR